jgi:hypothetical protein
MIPMFDGAKMVHALDRAATVIGTYANQFSINHIISEKIIYDHCQELLILSAFII